jgi:hypothetical protein
MAADGGGRRDDGVAGFAGRHEGVEVRHGARGHADLGKAGVEDLGRQFGGDDLDLLDGLQPHLVLVAGIAERGADPRREDRSASARGFITLAAGLRLKQSRSWIWRFFSASASIRAISVAAS